MARLRRWKATLGWCGVMAIKSTILRRLLLLGVPLLVGLLGLLHPVDPGESPYIIVAGNTTWWTVLHILQLPLFGLLALGVYTLVSGLPGRAPTVTRVGLAFFVIFYTALDSITGIASGIIVGKARDLNEVEQAAVEPLVNSLFLGGGPYTFIVVFAVIGWIVAVIAAASALSKAGVSRLPVILLVIAAVAFGLNHEPPTGPIGMAAMLGALALLEFAPMRYWRSCPVRYANQVSSCPIMKVELARQT
jgi:hypothetical protein